MEISSTDYELVKRCLAGEQIAFERLLSNYQNQIFSLILRMVRNQADAEDLAQETFLKAFKNLISYNPRYPFVTWLFKIAHNNVIDFLRARKPAHVPIGEDDEICEIIDTAPTPEQSSERHSMAEFVRQELNMLNPVCREVLILRHQEHLSYADIAQVLGVSEGAVKMRLFKAREMLREKLSEAGLETFLN